MAWAQSHIFGNPKRRLIDPRVAASLRTEAWHAQSTIGALVVYYLAEGSADGRRYQRYGSWRCQARLLATRGSVASDQPDQRTEVLKAQRSHLALALVYEEQLDFRHLRDPRKGCYSRVLFLGLWAKDNTTGNQV